MHCVHDTDGWAVFRSYRSVSPPGTPEEYMILLNNFLIHKFNHSNYKIILAGDFNLPRIDWVNYQEGQNEQAVP